MRVIHRQDLVHSVELKDGTAVLRTSHFLESADGEIGAAVIVVPCDTDEATALALEKQWGLEVVPDYAVADDSAPPAEEPPA